MSARTGGLISRLIPLLLCGAAAAAADQALLDREVLFDIEPKALDEALLDFASQAKVQLLSAAVEFRGQNAPAIKGRFAAAEALERLLRDTGMKYEVTGDSTVTVKPGTGAPVSALRPSGSSESVRSAQEATSDARAPAIEEVLVTAQKREERLQEVPISISVVSGVQLDKSTARGITEVLGQVPGVATSVAVQSGGTQVTVRGVTAAGPLFFGSSPVAYYLDSVPFGLVKSAIAPDSNAYDLARVEVLRGPQGTLYGASALNGVVRVLTQPANLEEFELKARAGGSSTERGGENYRGDMAINVPVVDGRLAARAVLGYEDLSGWIDKPNQRNANDAQLRNMRLKVDAEPTDALSIGLSTWRSRNEYGAPSTGDDRERNSSLFDEAIASDYDAYGLTLGYDFPGFSLASMTSYLDFSLRSSLDLAVYFGEPTPLFTGLDSEVFTQELLLTSSREGPWRWSIGGIYRDAEDRLIQTLITAAAPTNHSDLSASFAVFAELTRRFLEGRLELTGGLRYFEDDVTARENVRYTGISTEPLYRSDRTFDAVSPRVVLTWHHSDQLTWYGSYAEGFRSGVDQYAQIIAVAPQFKPVEPDELRNYELGSKGSFWNGHASFDVALYYIDWQDVQQSLSVTVNGAPFSVNVNGGSASGIGADFSMTVRPAAGLELGLSFSWNDLTTDSQTFSGGAVLFDRGDRLNISPEYTAGASVDYALPLGSSGFEARLSASGNYTSQLEYRTVESGVRRITTGDSMLIARMSFTLDSPGNWGATFFIDNVSDERGSPVRQPFVPTADWDARVRPRTVGVQLDYRF